MESPYVRRSSTWSKETRNCLMEAYFDMVKEEATTTTTTKLERGSESNAHNERFVGFTILFDCVEEFCHKQSHLTTQKRTYSKSYGISKIVLQTKPSCNNLPSIAHFVPHESDHRADTCGIRRGSTGSPNGRLGSMAEVVEKIRVDGVA